MVVMPPPRILDLQPIYHISVPINIYKSLSAMVFAAGPPNEGNSLEILSE
jgi:hypothetical protein